MSSWRNNNFLIFKEFFLIVLLFKNLLPGSRAQECRPQQFHLSYANQVLNISSPNYPAAYPTGTICRYRIVAPMDHVVQLQCVYELYPNACGTEYFYISRDGDFQLRDALFYCSSGSIIQTSHFRSIVLAYSSAMANTQLRGRFYCQARAERQRCECGWSQATKITNGQEAARHEFPSMVALRDITASQRIFCGGSIMSHRHILSAAHCTRTQPDARNVLAYVGDHDLSITNETPFEAQYRIQSIIRHPGYTPSSTDVANDIAIYLTATHIEWSRGVGPICLPFRQASESFACINVDVTGWGTLSFAGAKSNTLQKVSLLTMDNRVCQMQYNATILSSQMCTYDYRGLGQDSCQYDSGGPVIYRQQRHFLVAVISFGRTCGVRFAIGVNTRITSHLNWIWSFVAGSVCAT